MNLMDDDTVIFLGPHYFRTIDRSKFCTYFSLGTMGFHFFTIYPGVASNQWGFTRFTNLANVDILKKNKNPMQ